MKKQFLNLGKALSKAEQRQIKGGSGLCISSCGPGSPYTCPPNSFCQEVSCTWGATPGSAFYCVGVGPGDQ